MAGAQPCTYNACMETRRRKDPLRPAFGEGVRLRCELDGSALLLVPEGAFLLTGAAAAALALVDGRRTVEDIAQQISGQSEAAEEQTRTELAELFDRLCERRLLVIW
jgi:hypothetical protein